LCQSRARSSGGQRPERRRTFLDLSRPRQFGRRLSRNHLFLGRPPRSANGRCRWPAIKEMNLASASGKQKDRSKAVTRNPATVDAGAVSAQVWSAPRLLHAKHTKPARRPLAAVERAAPADRCCGDLQSPPDTVARRGRPGRIVGRSRQQVPPTHRATNPQRG